MEREIEIKVQGRVQGVRFRASVKSFADKYSIKGFIMNREDGSAVVVVQGEEEKLNELIKKIIENPGFSKIDSLNCKWRDNAKEYPDFRIVRKDSYVVDQMKSFSSLGKNMFGRKLLLPRHISIIPDGNRRWSVEKGLEKSFGHYRSGSYDNVKALIKESEKLGVKYLSIWGFSTENWKRDIIERKAIFELIIENIRKFRKDEERRKIKFRHVGRKDRLPKELVIEIEALEKETKDNKGLNVQFFLDYGGRDEIARAAKKIADEKIKKIDENSFSKYLDTYGIPDPDLIIRTGGEQRLSGMMPFQGVYAELYFIDKYFPDFGPEELREAVEEFSNRQRRFGK